jgi:hypothetical protein
MIFADYRAPTLGKRDGRAVDTPYCVLIPRADRVDLRGRAHAAFGHRLPTPASGVADGIFAGWEWDGTRLAVTNDQYGIQPLFWARFAGGGIGVSPSIVALIEQGAPVELDAEALAVFFRLGFFVGDDTPFAAIRAVPPNAAFIWKRDQFECRGRYPDIPPASPISRDDAIDAYIDLFARAMAKRQPVPETCGIPVSGGRDSRHILLELQRTGRVPSVCVSALDHPPDPNEDPRIAATLCEALRFRHVIVEQQLSPFRAELRKNMETSFCARTHGWYLAVADFMNGRFGCTYDGIAGDVLSQSKFLSASLDSAFRSRNIGTICAALLAMQPASAGGLHGILKGDLRRCLEPDLAKGRLAMEVARHLDRPNPVGSFIFWNRTRREIALAPYGMLKDIPVVYAPFLDHALFDFLASLPSSMLLDHHFHDDTIARAYPDFAHIPYAKNAAPGADDSMIRARFMREMARNLLFRKPSRLVKTAGPRIKLLTSVISNGGINPWVSPIIIYMNQLESLMDGRRRGVC